MLAIVLVCLFVACNSDAKEGSAAQRGSSAAASSAGRTSTGFSGTAAYDYAKTQVAFGPRVPGTSAAKQAGDWIIRQMRARADTVIVQSFTHTTADGKKLALRNILARFRPELTERVLYVTHWDSRPISDSPTSTEAEKKMPVPGANDGASGVGLFVALGDVLKKTKPNVGVDLLFTDGEDYGQFGPPEVDVLIGSKYFADHPPSPGYKPLYGVLWDMIGDKDLRIPYEMNSFQQAPEVVSRVWQTAADMGYGDIFVQESGGLVVDDHIPLLNSGMRVIDVIDLDYPPHHTPQDTMDKISAKSLATVGDVATALVTRK